ncbi:hypothetical protein K469DRAFT_753359 [Zopfia rhizophila CBS 207.26]|uniref:Zn(2)-C6 fungal-type domain-containing protein n=1 Tax=Zopfia rhizophila CBS 207.26 TaxID=1314779 RepID=A0A6A6DMN1_9PEZI|nr:hypothetical protein K469DRAFT_753359 [Zopfia rhizophila CBS 207.26]
MDGGDNAGAMDTAERPITGGSAKGTRTSSNNRRKPKSRTGCQRCKSKRRRCDESKPACSECVKRGQICPGYQGRSLRWRYMFQDDSDIVPTGNDNVCLSIDRPALAQLDPTGISNMASNEELDQRQNAPQATDEHESIVSCLDSWCLDQSPEMDLLDSSLFQVNSPTERVLGLLNSTFPLDNLSVLHQRLSNTTIPAFLIHLPTILVQYYFDYVCAIFSSFDSALNPFRTTVGQLWTCNAAIYFAIQSMSAASLANDFPSMRAVGLQMQQHAYECLQDEIRANSPLRDANATFFALLMIGSTTAWHNGGDLGLGYLEVARSFLAHQPNIHVDQDANLEKQYSFFKQCLLYWNMSIAFVAEETQELTDSEDASSSAPDPPLYFVNGQTLPHPWKGPLPEILDLFYKTARLVRVARKTSFWHLEPVDIFPPDFSGLLLDGSGLSQRAEHLEEALLACDILSDAGSVPTGDQNTPPSHFITLAEIYRCVALLQIYHVFPSIFSQRILLQGGSATQSEAIENPSEKTPLPFPIAFPSPFHSVPDGRRLLALHIVSLLDQLPTTSGTRCMQPVLLVATAGDLSFSTRSLFSIGATSLTGFNIQDLEVARARRRVTTRLNELMQILPKPPIERIYNIASQSYVDEMKRLIQLPAEVVNQIDARSSLSSYIRARTGSPTTWKCNNYCNSIGTDICGDNRVMTCLKLTCVSGVGRDHIDLEACQARGIRICNTPVATVEAVAEHAIAL